MNHNNLIENTEKEVVVKVNNVTKIFKIFKDDRERIKGLILGSKFKRTKTALKNISFEIKESETVAILGRNGAGKSTLSKIISGVTYPTHGTIEVNRKITSLLELTTGFDGNYTGRENIYLRAMLMDIPKKEIEKYVDSIIDFADIGEFIDVQYKKYSSGMAARLGFAFNSCLNPEILLVDEALSVGDENFSKKCLNKVKEILKNNSTFILVTHSMETAREFCKRGIIIHNSEIFFDGDIDEATKIYHTINQNSEDGNEYDFEDSFLENNYELDI